MTVHCNKDTIGHFRSGMDSLSTWSSWCVLWPHIFIWLLAARIIWQGLLIVCQLDLLGVCYDLILSFGVLQDALRQPVDGASRGSFCCHNPTPKPVSLTTWERDQGRTLAQWLQMSTEPVQLVYTFRPKLVVHSRYFTASLSIILTGLDICAYYSSIILSCFRVPIIVLV